MLVVLVENTDLTANSYESHEADAVVVNRPINTISEKQDVVEMD